MDSVSSKHQGNKTATDALVTLCCEAVRSGVYLRRLISILCHPGITRFARLANLETRLSP